MKKYNVMIVDDQPLYRKGMIQILNSHNVVQDLYEVTTDERALKQLEKSNVDIIFLYYMAGVDGFETVKTILARKKDSKIIVVSNVDSVAVILNFFKMGAKGFLHKTADEQHLLDAMRTVSLNDLYYFTRFEEDINWWLKVGLEGKVPTIRLSERERQVVTEIARGKTSKEISLDLGLDIRTIETYRYDLLKKFGVRNTAEMLSYLFANAIIR